MNDAACGQTFADQIRVFVPVHYIGLSADNFGCSDARANLRHHFEADRYHIAYVAITTLAAEVDGKGRPRAAFLPSDPFRA